MATVEPDIDELVRRVMVRLRSAESATPAAREARGCLGQSAAPPRQSWDVAPGTPLDGNAGPLGPSDGQSSAGVSSAARELHIVGPVVSAGQLAGQLAGIRRVVVGSGAVVTPAAHDLLRGKNIELARGDATSCGPRPDIVVGVAETAWEPASLVRTLRQQGVRVQSLARCGLLSAVDEIVDAVVKGGQLGVLLTAQTAAAICLANRTHGVRAALGVDLKAVRGARAAIGANLLVVDPAGRGLFELVELVRACATGPPNCPEPLRQRLG